jgi:hypothetical protein
MRVKEREMEKGTVRAKIRLYKQDHKSHSKVAFVILGYFR